MGTRWQRTVTDRRLRWRASRRAFYWRTACKLFGLIAVTATNAAENAGPTEQVLVCRMFHRSWWNEMRTSVPLKWECRYCQRIWAPMRYTG